MGVYQMLFRLPKSTNSENRSGGRPLCDLRQRPTLASIVSQTDLSLFRSSHHRIRGKALIWRRGYSGYIDYSMLPLNLLFRVPST